jgi:hypothetical protein
MPLYRTVLVRSFDVTIEAEDENAALRLSEFFVGYADHSNSHDKEKFRFEIKNIEMTENDALETTLIEDSDEYAESME